MHSEQTDIMIMYNRKIEILAKKHYFQYKFISLQSTNFRKINIHIRDQDLLIQTK